MSHTNKKIRLSAKMFLLSIGLTLAACGGGGGGGSSSNGIPAAAVKYTGQTASASVTDAIAEEIAKAYITADQENVGGLVTGISTATSQAPLDSSAKNSLIEKLKQDAIASINQNSIVAGVTGTVLSGNCADLNPGLGISNGSATQSTLSQSSNEVVTKISYNNLCFYDSYTTAHMIINGDVYATVKGDLQNGIINSITINVPSLTVNYVNASTNQNFTETISEYFAFIFENYDVNGNPTKITIIDYSDIDSAGKVYRFEVVTVTDDSVTPSKVTTKIKFYHPDYGWVEYEDNLTYTSCGIVPDGGSFTVIGANATYTVTLTGSCGSIIYTVT